MASSPASNLFPTLFVLLLFILLTTAIADGFELAKEKKTNLQFYVHVASSGPNATTALVAGLNKTSSTFGNMDVYDNILRKGPKPSSKLLGRIQGIDSQASLGSPANLAVYNFVFTTGEYNGSTLAMMGWHELQDQAWEQSVIGGSGGFRFARGFALAELVTFSNTYIVISFNVYVLH